jgi:hypothetical protein
VSEGERGRHRGGIESVCASVEGRERKKKMRGKELVC